MYTRTLCICVPVLVNTYVLYAMYANVCLFKQEFKVDALHPLLPGRGG